MVTKSGYKSYKGEALPKAVARHEKAEISHEKKQLKRDEALLADAKKAKKAPKAKAKKSRY